MDKKILRISIAQINPTVGDLKGNSLKILDYIRLAEEKKCDVVTFPELTLTGYPPEDLLLKPKFVKDNIIFLREIAKKAGDIVAIIGFVDKDKSAIYNSAAIIYKHRIWGIYNKMFLPNYGVFDEKRYFSSGKTYLFFEIDEICCGVNICEDIWEKTPFATMLKLGAKVIFNINASPYHRGKIDLRKNVLLNHTKSSNCLISYNNLVGGQDELVFDGRSMIVQGKNLIGEGKAFEEDLIIYDFDASSFEPCRVKRNIVNATMVKIPKKLEIKSGSFKAKILTKKVSAEEEVFSALILGLRDYVRKNDFKKVIIGLSGGIDSALTATLAVRTLGSENVLTVYMPSQFSSADSKALSLQLANNLGIKLKEISIQGIFERFKEDLKDIFKNLKEDITEENLQARIRGTLLMALSNKFGWLVVTTGNKSEMSTGFATLYGDMAGGFALLKDVPKQLVFDLARYINKKEEKEIIPQGIIDRVPTAELKLNQKDSDTLPPYEILDKIIKLYVEENFSLEEIVKKGFDKKIVEKVIKLIDKAEYKRRQSPPGVKITPRAFGKDRRMPITNRYLG